MYKGEGKGRVDLTRPPHMRLTRLQVDNSVSLLIQDMSLGMDIL